MKVYNVVQTYDVEEDFGDVHGEDTIVATFNSLELAEEFAEAYNGLEGHVTEETFLESTGYRDMYDYPARVEAIDVIEDSVTAREMIWKIEHQDEYDWED